jgi:hypothetical protein
MTSRKEALIALKLKKEDPIELPMDEMFFEKMHQQIMQAVDKTEIKQQTKWSKTKVFLETKGRKYLPDNGKVLKTVFMMFVASLTLGLGGLSAGLFKKTHDLQVASLNQKKILIEAVRAPDAWNDLAAMSQNDSDLYQEILNQKIQQSGFEAAQAMKDL